MSKNWINAERRAHSEVGREGCLVGYNIEFRGRVFWAFRLFFSIVFDLVMRSLVKQYHKGFYFSKFRKSSSSCN